MTLRDFEKLADDAKLGKPLVRARLTEVTERVRDALPKVPVTDPVAEKVADLIRRRSEMALGEFGAGDERPLGLNKLPRKRLHEDVTGEA